MRSEDFLPEHTMVWKRSKSGKVRMKWRCMSGPRAGRTVPSVSDCSKAPDVAQSIRMKKTRAQTKVRQAVAMEAAKEEAAREVGKAEEMGVVVMVEVVVELCSLTLEVMFRM